MKKKNSPFCMYIVNCKYDDDPILFCWNIEIDEKYIFNYLKKYIRGFIDL